MASWRLLAAAATSRDKRYSGKMGTDAPSPIGWKPSQKAQDTGSAQLKAQFQANQQQAAQKAQQAAKEFENVKVGSKTVKQHKQDMAKPKPDITISAGPDSTVSLPASEVSRHSFEASKTIKGSVTTEAIERARTAAIAAEVQRTGGVSFRTAPSPEMSSYQRQQHSRLTRPQQGQPGVQYRYNVELRDNLNLGGGRPEGVNYAYDVQLKEQFGGREPPAPREQFKPASNDPYSGALAVGENILDSLVTTGKVISKAPAAFAGSSQAWYDIEYELARYDERYKPEAEGGFIGVGIGAAKEQITTGQTSGAAKQFSDLTKSIVENPGYFVGSAAASAALWFGPGAGAKVRGIVKGARTVVTQERGFESLAKITPDLIKRPGAVEVTRQERKFVEAFTPGITVQQVGKTKMFDFGTELTDPSVSRYVGGRINPKTGDIDLITRELLEKPEQFVVPKGRRGFVYDLESFGVKQVKEGQPRKVGMARGSDIYEPETFRIEKVTQLPTKMPEMPIFKTSTTEREIQKFIDPYREQRGKLVATIETFKPSELEAYAKAISRPTPAASATPSIRAFRSTPSRAKSQPAATSQSQMTVQPRLSDVEKAATQWADDTLKADKASEKALSDFVKVGTGAGVGVSALGSAPSALGLGGGANVFTNRQSIGFGGATGAERKRRKQDDFEYTIGLERIPGVTPRQFNKGLITPDMRDALDVGSRFRGGSTTRDVRAQNQALAQYNKMLKDLQPRLDGRTAIRTDTGLKVDSLTSQRVAQAEATALRQQLNQVFGRASIQGRIQRAKVIPRMRVPRTRLLPIPQYSPPRIRKGGKRKKGLQTRIEKQDVTDLVALGFGKDYAKAFNKQFGLSDIYDT